MRRILVACLILLEPSVAWAFSTLSESASFAVDKGGGIELSVPQFDSMLGLLQAVRFSLPGYTVVSLEVIVDWEDGQLGDLFNITLQAPILLTAPGISAERAVSVTRARYVTAPDDDAAPDFMGLDTVVLPSYTRGPYEPPLGTLTGGALGNYIGSGSDAMSLDPLDLYVWFQGPSLPPGTAGLATGPVEFPGNLEVT